MFLNYSILFVLVLRAASFGSATFPANVLDYRGTPKDASDRNQLVFSDQGAWFGYSIPDDSSALGGFCGPFLMTQENGKWCSKVLSRLILYDANNKPISWSNFAFSQESYSSHLKQKYKNKELSITQTLFFNSAHTAIITTHIENLSENSITFSPRWQGSLLLKSLKLKEENGHIIIESEKSDAVGHIQLLNSAHVFLEIDKNNYVLGSKKFEINPGQSKSLTISHSFIFSQYNWEDEQNSIVIAAADKEIALNNRIAEKERQFAGVINQMATPWNKFAEYKKLAAKILLTLQNNWRIAAGELRHSGLFPSYHYIWFHGFWAWDSWKHAVALTQFDSELAKQQVRAMYDFMDNKGFIADCVFRDTTIENHNLRNSKPPLSGWAVWEIYKSSNDLEFLKEMYPKIQTQHKWWYIYRDNDKDGLCEYGSTDGTLLAAKWESGMDNAVRFDSSKILRNEENAYSLNQESVDLNAYLYAEKKYLFNMAQVLKYKRDMANYAKALIVLKSSMLRQFYDSENGWFYDTSIDGKKFIKAMGCEGWIPLWAGFVDKKQAAAIKQNIMNPDYFNLKIPLQTLSASHPKFNPDGGYWRGPLWLDQAYFGIAGLKNYNFDNEADELTYKLFKNAEGVLENGRALRENYNPVNGRGLAAKNFSWSAAHYLLLLLNK